MGTVTASVRPLALDSARVGRGLFVLAWVVWSALRLVAIGAGRVVSWVGRHRRWSLCLGLPTVLAFLLGESSAGRVLLVVWLLPGVVAVIWKALAPSGFERWCAGPVRRYGWRRWVRRSWSPLARECGLSVQRTPRRGVVAALSNGPEPAPQWIGPYLMNVSTSGAVMTLLIRARAGQTTDDITDAVPAIASAAEAVSYRTAQRTPSVLEVVLVMGDLLAETAAAVSPNEIQVESVTIGRCQDGTPFVLPLLGRQTLVVGCSGSGKGSVLWGVAGGLAPAVSSDVVRLWGIDLKGGVEVGMGAGLFTATAYNHVDARAMLQRLLTVINARTAAMLGRSRLHVPCAGDPLHVLIIDELAALTSYETDSRARDEASRMLSEVLTKGRAVGVLVVAFVQDPTKKTVEMRDLFTQTLALRVKTADQTRMILGEGMAGFAPAHKISPAMQGAGWLVLDDGTAERVRADYWPDDQVRAVAHAFPAPVIETLPGVAATPAHAEGVADPYSNGPVPAGRSRKPRTPRGPRPSTSDEAA